MPEPSLYATKDKEKRKFTDSIEQNVVNVKSMVSGVKAIRVTVLTEKAAIDASKLDAADKTGLMGDCDKIVAYIDSLIK